MDSKSAVGLVWVILGILYAAVGFLSDWNGTVMIVGALIYAIVAVTSKYWSRALEDRVGGPRR